MIKILLSAAFISVFILAFSVSEKDINACVEKTGWSEQRCKVEMTR